MNRSLENEIAGIKNNKNNDESKYLEQAMKIAALNEKVLKVNSEKAELEKESKQLTLTLQQQQKLLSEREN